MYGSETWTMTQKGSERYLRCGAREKWRESVGQKEKSMCVC